MTGEHDGAELIEASSFGGAVVRVYDGGFDRGWIVEAGEPGPAGWESGLESIEFGDGPVARRIAELVAEWTAVRRDLPLVRVADRDGDGVAAIERPQTPGDVVVVLRRLRWAWSEPSAEDVLDAGLDPAAVERACVSALTALAPAPDHDADPPARLRVLADEIAVVADRLDAVHGADDTVTGRLALATGLVRGASAQLTEHPVRHHTGDAA